MVDVLVSGCEMMAQKCPQQLPIYNPPKRGFLSPRKRGGMVIGN